jgi:NADH-quinone oxidoreductase subunit F
MKSFSSIEEFSAYRSSLSTAPPSGKPTLIVSAGTCGQASGANTIIRAVKKEILDRALQDKINLQITGCQGFCQIEPFILVKPGDVVYPWLKPESVSEIIDAVLTGKIVDKLLYRESEYHPPARSIHDIPFFGKQVRSILGQSESIDPIRVRDYLKMGGYGAFQKALEVNDPVWIIEEVKKSGLRGRGGAGFSTGKKWEFARKSAKGKGPKYVVCNADEGDPGAYMDRSVLEGNPHAVLEGIMIAGVAIGANQGIVYVRNEYPLAIKHLRIAIRQARDMRLLGKNILGTGFDFEIDIVQGAGAFVCGEETALIRSIEGKMGEPRQRPPYPVEKGIFGRPTSINNVETFANVPLVIADGADAYAKVGVPGNSGTKIFSLVGKIRNTGLVEVPMGMTFKEIVYDIGGGPVGKAPIKAVQTGGPSGGCIPASFFNLPIDYDSLSKAGSIMGSGGMIVMDERSCMVDIARYYMKFLKDESCGKCFTCRKGTQRMYEILEDITEGRGTLDQIELLEELAQVVADSTMCGLGQTAPNPVLSTLRYFKDEYIEHILNRNCRAGVCKDLVGAPCQSSCPVGTEAWRYIAHIAAGEYEQAYGAIREFNPFPSICSRVCDHKCEEHCKLGTTGNRPVAIRALKRFITDTVDPSNFKPERSTRKHPERVAIVGAGPAGLTAAHYLSLKGYPVTVFEGSNKLGGMMQDCIPPYRLPAEILDKEIASLIDDNITVELNKTLGQDITIDSLYAKGFKAVFVGIGAQKGRRLQIPGEEVEGVIPSLEFLKNFSRTGVEQAEGHVVVVGGGNSAIDAARTALRQSGVTEVTILYRRTREEMPAFAEEIEAAIEEGIKLETLITPLKILSEKGKVTGIECIRNSLGEIDASGRRKPVPIKGSEFKLQLDRIIVAISEQPDVDSITPHGERAIKITDDGKLAVDSQTLTTSRPGVFAGGDVTTGPNTVIDAIAAGKRAAVMIERYLTGEEMKQLEKHVMPSIYIPPAPVSEQELLESRRVELPRADAQARRGTFTEVEMRLAEKEAKREARRCLRCDLDFTQPKASSASQLATNGSVAARKQPTTEASL